LAENLQLKKRMDNPAASASVLQIMSQPTAPHSPDIKLEKLTSPVGLVVDAILVVGFFAFLFSLLKSHVPSNDPMMVFIWAGLTSGCMSGVFWLAIQMFRVVLTAQRLAKKQKR
jgi:hypothetical protein